MKPGRKKGFKLSEETKRKISKAKTGRKRLDITGEKNTSWNGGRCGYCKRVTLIRDNYTCQKCGFSDKEIMIVDHIKPKSVFSELEFSINNLMTLCPNCNAKKTLNDIRKYQKGIKRGDKWRTAALA